MSEFSNLSLVSGMIGKLANLNLGYVKSADLTAKELNIIVTNIYFFLSSKNSFQQWNLF